MRQIFKEPPLKKRCTVQFKEDSTVSTNDQEETVNFQQEERESDQKNIRTRIEILKFKVNSNKTDPITVLWKMKETS